MPAHGPRTNRQVRNGNGDYIFNADGTPQFDGKLLLVGIDPFMFAKIQQGAPVAAQILSATLQNQVAERALTKANIALDQAKTNSEKKAATTAIEDANKKIAETNQKHKELTDRKESGSTFGELITLSLAQGTGNLIGLALEMGVGAGVTTGIPFMNPSVNLEVGSVSVTMPRINLVVVNPRLQQSYDCSNSLGLDLSMINYFKALAFKLTIAGKSLINIGPLYQRTDPIFDKDLAIIRHFQFPVRSPVLTLGAFDLVKAKADLQVQLLSGPPSSLFVTPADPNPLLTFTVQVINNGISDATGVKLTNYFSSQMKFSPANSSPGITLENEFAIFNIGDLAAGQSTTLTFAGNYVSGSSTSNWLFVRGNEFDPEPSNNELNSTTSMTLPLVFHVNTESELRAAIAQVNNATAVVSPVIYLRTTFLTLTQGEIAISKSVIITSFSGDNVVFDAQGQSRHFRLGGDGKQTYRFEYVGLSGGNGAGVDEGLGGSILLIDEGLGGSILLIDEDDTLSMENSAVIQSTALTGAKLGGGIYQRGGFLNLQSVRVVDNQAETGGGLYLENTTANFNDAIILTNSATIQGGGLEAIATNGGSSSIAIGYSDFSRRGGGICCQVCG